MRELSLSPRLEEIAGLVPKGAGLADIGTDHAYLPVWLLRKRVISHAIAADLREGPLTRGKAVAEEWGIPVEQITFRCCDGLKGLAYGEADTIVIAGMGGETIAAILGGVDWAKTPGLRYLLQPMSSIPELRLWLWEHAYHIVEERIVVEGKNCYVILSVQPGKATPYTQGELWAGKQTQGMHAPHRRAYLDDLIKRRNRALEGMRRGTERVSVQKRETEALLKELIQLREEWLLWQQ